MATLGNLENKPVLVSEMREYVGNISAHARGGNTLKATKTGAMVSVDDAYAGRLLKLTAYGNSVQDGTPTPETPVPIKSVANIYATIVGRNILPTKAAETTEHYGVTFVRNTDGTVKITGTATSNAYFTLCSATYDHIVILPNMYLQSGLAGNSDENIELQNRKNGSGGAQITANATTATVTTTTSTSNYPAILHSRICVKSGATVNATVYPFLVIGSDSFDANPAYSSTTTLTLVDSEGNSHELRSLPDGTKDELVINADGSGTLVENCPAKKLKDFSWFVSNSGSSSYFYQAALHAKANAPINMVSNAFPTASASITTSNTVEGIATTVAKGDQLRIRYGAEKTADAFASSLSDDAIVVYAAAIPATYHIPAINMPALPDLVSNCWLSATDASGAAIPCEIGIEYRRDINKVIEDIETAIADIVSA